MMAAGKKLANDEIRKVKELFKDYSVAHVAKLMNITPTTVKKYKNGD